MVVDSPPWARLVAGENYIYEYTAPSENSPLHFFERHGPCRAQGPGLGLCPEPCLEQGALGKGDPAFRRHGNGCICGPGGAGPSARRPRHDGAVGGGGTLGRCWQRRNRQCRDSEPRARARRGHTQCRCWCQQLATGSANLANSMRASKPPPGQRGARCRWPSAPRGCAPTSALRLLSRPVVPRGCVRVRLRRCTSCTIIMVSAVAGGGAGPRHGSRSPRACNCCVVLADRGCGHGWCMAGCRASSPGCCTPLPSPTHPHPHCVLQKRVWPN